MTSPGPVAPGGATGVNLGVDAIDQFSVITSDYTAEYPFGYLATAVCMQFIVPHFGWQVMFLVGTPLAVLVIILTALSPESTAWKLNHMGSVLNIVRTLWQQAGSFASSALSPSAARGERFGRRMNNNNGME